MLSQDDLDKIRDYVGSTPSDDALSNLYDSLGSWPQVALRVLRRRLADMTATPSSVTLPGVLSASTAANIKALGEQIAELEQLANSPDPDAETVSQSSTFLCRPAWR